MAVALFDDSGELCGAIALAGPGDRLTSEAMDRCEADLRAVAITVSQELGFRGGYPPSASDHSPERHLSVKS
jgi:DNA-binding IclR family transcriptional regulator